MALWFDLMVNAEHLGIVEIRRLEHRDLTDPATADTWNTYDVSRDGRLVGQVRHVYGHGAWHLLSLATSLLATDALSGPLSAPLTASEPPVGGSGRSGAPGALSASEARACGAFEPLEVSVHPAELMPYRCTEPHGHRGPHRASINGRAEVTWDGD